ncbi:MAG: PDZ domain-containing protein [Anaerolineae bacterium]|nr:PDZ domain-containing protein [Thermoflexales bacterium]MDW8408637.1 PDZ domain-containing protein [Anaerolineae bacterium]
MIVKTVPFLGLEWHVRPSSGEQPSNQVVVVRKVLQDSPAHRAGLQPGDIIHSVDGTPLTEEVTLTDQIIRKKPGSIVALEVTRKDKKTHFKVTLGERHVSLRQYMSVPRLEPRPSAQSDITEAR